MEAVNRKKRTIEISLLVILTIVLMLIFYGKKKYFSDLSDEGIRFLAKYAEGLKPINKKVEYSNEDIVNFALYGNLPLDKRNNKYLILNENSEGKLKYIITDAAPKTESNNYEKLTLKFEDNQSKQILLDTILTASKANLYKSILFSDNETYAISPKVLEIQNELKKEIAKLAAVKSSELKLRKNEFSNQIKKLDKELSASNNFIFVNPDTVVRFEGKIKRLVNSNGKTKKIVVAADEIDLSKLNYKDIIKKVEFSKGDGFVSIEIPSVKVPKSVNLNHFETGENFKLQFSGKENEFSFNIEKLPRDLQKDLENLNSELSSKLGMVNVKFDSTGIYVKIPDADNIRENIKRKRK